MPVAVPARVVLLLMVLVLRVVSRQNRNENENTNDDCRYCCNVFCVSGFVQSSDTSEEKSYAIMLVTAVSTARGLCPVQQQ